MEPGALIFVTLVGLGGFGLLWFRIREAMGDPPALPDLWPRHYVTTANDDDSSELAEGWRSTAVEPIVEPAQTEPEPQPVPRFEREPLVRHLAAIVVLEPDGSERLLSQDIISRAAGMSKERTAEIMREVRNQPAPVKKPEPYQFKKVGIREQWVREDAKPLR